MASFFPPECHTQCPRARWPSPFRWRLLVRDYFGLHLSRLQDPCSKWLTYWLGTWHNIPGLKILTKGIWVDASLLRECRTCLGTKQGILCSKKPPEKPLSRVSSRCNELRSTDGNAAAIVGILAGSSAPPATKRNYEIP